MQFTVVANLAWALISASSVMGAAVNTNANNGVAIRAAPSIATDQYSACNCPNNCNHQNGSSCKYYSGPSDQSTVISGTCSIRDGKLTCIAK